MKHFLENKINDIFINKNILILKTDTTNIKIKMKEITKYHRSGDLVFNIKNKYILKVSKNIGLLQKEKYINDFLVDKANVSKSCFFIIKDNTGYYLKTSVKGSPLCSKKFLRKPKKLVKYLVEAINIFHNISYEGCLIRSIDCLDVEEKTFIHGDFCLPNILVSKNKIGFIDLGNSGIGDKWADYSWALWSLEYNLKTNKYSKMFLDMLNINFDEKKYNFYIKFD